MFQKQYEKRLEQHYQAIERDRQIRLEQQRFLRKQREEDIKKFSRKRLQQKEIERK
jgi:hypothetical protein